MEPDNIQASTQVAPEALLEHTPHFRVDEAIGFARVLFGIRGTAEPLASERDQNFLIETDLGERFVLKIANSLEKGSFVGAQAEVMRHVGRHIDLCPSVLPTQTGESFERIISESGVAHWIRMVSYLTGQPMSGVPNQSLSLLRDLGRKLGRLDTILADFDHPTVRREFHWDVMNGPRVVEKYGQLIADDGMRKLVVSIADRFEREVVPLTSQARTSVIHNDANSDNVLVQGDSVVGLIDFGDMVYSCTVGELAVAIAYAVLDSNDPLRVATTIVEGYHSENPLEDIEIEVLWGFVLMRLGMSASIAAHQRSMRPENEYLNVSQGPISRTLPRLVIMDTEKVRSAFREACRS